MAEGVLVEFYTEVVEDKEKSVKEGRFIGKEIEMVRKTMGLNSITVDRANEADKERFKPEYDAFKAGEEAPVTGTPCAECSLFSKTQVEEMKRQGIMTLEDLIAVPDSRLPGPGMKPLRDKAKAYLETAASVGVVAAEVTELRKLTEDLARKNEDLTTQINSLTEKKTRKRNAA